MRISLFGIGYVGSVAAACLARDGHEVLAVDTHPQKVAALDGGGASLVEPGLQALIQAGLASGRLRATVKGDDAAVKTQVSLVCVGTPTLPDGTMDFSAVERVATTIANALPQKPDFHVVIVRSTLTPGAMRTRVLPLMERISGLTAGVDFGLAYYPEFLREGSALQDYDDPGASVIAVTDQETLARALSLHPKTADPPLVVPFEEAEANKMVSNVWRALKVTFANEVGAVLGGLGVDSHEVMQAVCRDGRLNISPAYMRPGFAFGGSCLPKDLRAFAALGRAGGRRTPLLDRVLEANRNMIGCAVSRVEAAGRRRVSMFGLAFKPGTDDLRESPYLALAQQLVAKGFDLRIFDPDVRPVQLTGANLAHAEARLPCWPALLGDTLQAVVDHGQTLVLAHPPIGAAALDLARDDQHVLDLTRVRPHLRTAGNYEGLSW